VVFIYNHLVFLLISLSCMSVYVVICQLTCMLIYNLQVCYCTISSKEEFDARESLVIHSVDLNSLYGYEGVNVGIHFNNWRFIY